MEDWHDYVFLIGNSLGFALVSALVVFLPIYAIARGIHSLRKFRHEHTWRSDLLMLWPIPIILFGVVFVIGLGVGSMFSDMCGTRDVTETVSPDAKHKIVVYSFDCGATTDYSFMVSLLRSKQKVLKYRAMNPLYSIYHQRAMDANFTVTWNSPSHVTVTVDHLKGIQSGSTKHQDGVDITFEDLH